MGKVWARLDQQNDRLHQLSCGASRTISHSSTIPGDRFDPHTVEAAGSNPAAPTKENARLADFHGRPASRRYGGGHGFSPPIGVSHHVVGRR